MACFAGIFIFHTVFYIIFDSALFDHLKYSEIIVMLLFFFAIFAALLVRSLLEKKSFHVNDLNVNIYIH